MVLVESLRPDLMAFILIVSLVLLSIFTQKMDVPGALVGGIIALCLYVGAGFNGLFLLITFFVGGNIATKWKIQEKIKSGVAQEAKGKRSIRHAVANGGVAAIWGLAGWLFPAYGVLFHLMLAASLASSMADTLSSELGNVYGRNFYNIINGQRDQRGVDGVISLEGTLLGASGSCFIALIYGLGTHIGIGVVWVAISGIVGNAADSILGATVQRQGYLTNDGVNLVNTLVAGGVICVLYFINL